MDGYNSLTFAFLSAIILYMPEESKSYQLNIILPPTISQEKTSQVVEQIKKWITDKEGKISQEEKENEGQIKKLSYLIQKNSEGIYCNLNFSLPASAAKELTDYLNLNNEIIRFMLKSQKAAKTESFAPGRKIFKEAIKKPAKETIDQKIVEKIEPLPSQQTPLAKETDKKETNKEPEPKREEKGKTKLEELDKKLEEILGE